MDKRRLGGSAAAGVERGSDSDSRRRDVERVRFAPDTVVQTGDGRAVIVDDSTHTTATTTTMTGNADWRSPTSRRGRTGSPGGTLPARLRGHAVRRTLPPEFEQRAQKDSAIDLDRVVRKSAPSQRQSSRPMSAVFDDEETVRFAASGGAAAVRTGSVPMSINVLHRGGNSAAAGAKLSPRDSQGGASTRRAVDSAAYYRDSAAKIHRR